MSLILYRSNRIEELSASLARLLQDPLPHTSPLDAVLQPETVVVHSMGMQRWLSMQLSAHLGVASNIDYPFPTRLIHTLLTTVTGAERSEHPDAWLPNRLVWYILQELDQCLELAPFAPLRQYLNDTGASDAGITRTHYYLARRIADTFDKYITYRPSMVLEWEDETNDPHDDWQPLLWKRLQNTIHAPHPARMAQNFLETLQRGEELPHTLPHRLVLFGVSTLPPLYVDILNALSSHLPVHFFLLCPSRLYWGHIQSRREIAARLQDAAHLELEATDLFLEEGNPLLSSFGRVGRDFQCILEGQGSVAPYQETNDDLFVEPDTHRRTLLTLLQRDILDLRYPGGVPGQELDEDCYPPAHVISPGDRSVEFHDCHGPLRQVEVLRDRLLQLLNDDPTLEPRDVLILTPDIARYAPLLEAVLSDGDAPGASFTDKGFPRLPFSIADRSVASQNPVVESLLAILALSKSRVTSTGVLELLNLAPIRDRFEITMDHVSSVRQWVQESGIRWAMDDAHREAQGHPATRETTWMFGLDRLLLGYACEGEELFGGTVALGDAGASEPELLGRLAAFCRALFDTLRRLNTPQPMDAWCHTLKDILGKLTLAPTGEEWLSQQVLSCVDAAGRAARAAAVDDPIDLDALSAALNEHLEATPEFTNFLNGGITCCALVPMRSVPFRVVCLLGMDDNTFPRQVTPLGFDLTAQHPRLGDRTPRDDDRYLLLESILSARDNLIVTYTGRSVHDNQPCPPAVPVGELQDCLERSFQIATSPDTSMLTDLVTLHPLQPFSPAAFQASESTPEGPFSFNKSCFTGAQKLVGERVLPPPFMAEALPPNDASNQQATTVSLDELRRFIANPAAFLLRERCDITFWRENHELHETTLLDLGGLDAWRAGDLLCRLQSGPTPPHDMDAFLKGTGAIPPGTLGERALQTLHHDAGGLLQGFGPFANDTETFVDVHVTLRPGLSLAGRVMNLRGSRLARLQYAKCRSKHLLELWVDHLALQASGRAPATSTLVARDKNKVPNLFCLDPLSDDLVTNQAEAIEHLEALVHLMQRGSHLPLPLFPEASRAYAHAITSDPESEAKQATGRNKAAQAWANHNFATGRPGGDSVDPAIKRLFEESLPYEANFTHPGLPPDDDLSFHALSQQVWGPLLNTLQTLKVSA